MECAATAPGGFAKDEAFGQLGTHLLLPPWFEERRTEIEAMLEPIHVPEANQVGVPAGNGAGPSHRKPVFVTPKGEPVGSSR